VEDDCEKTADEPECGVEGGDGSGQAEMADASMSLHLEDSFLRSCFPPASMDTAFSFGEGSLLHPERGDSRGSVPDKLDSRLDLGDSHDSRLFDSRWPFGRESSLDREGSKLGELSFSKFNANLSNPAGDKPVEAPVATDAGDMLQTGAEPELRAFRDILAGDAADKKAPHDVARDEMAEAAERRLFDDESSRQEASTTSRGKKRPRTECAAPPVEAGESTESKRGWTDEELSRFRNGVVLHGVDFEAVARCVGSKKADQVRIQFRKEFGRAQQHYRNEGVIVPAQRGVNANLGEQLVLLKQWWLDVGEEQRAAEKRPREQKKRSAKHRVQLVPEYDHDEALLRNNGYNPLVVVILRGHRPLADVHEHLTAKWRTVISAGSRLELLLKMPLSSSIDQFAETFDQTGPLRIRYKLSTPEEPLRMESTLSKLLGDSCPFGDASLPDSVTEEVVPLTCEDANDGLQESSSNDTTSGGLCTSYEAKPFACMFSS